MQDVSCHPFFQAIQTILHDASAAIMAVYQNSDLQVAQKDDNSPVTAADMAAHHVILAGLQALTPDIPVLSEEAVVDYQQRKQWPLLWVVDPLDGTKEFIKRNGEFSINIALVSHHKSILGAVYLPVTGEGYFGVVEEYEQLPLGAVKWQGKQLQPIHTREPGDKLVVMTSRSHGPGLPGTLKELLLEQCSEVEEIPKGSSIKACRIAEGRADMHLRRGPTSEWDTAASQAVVEAAGGALMSFSGEPFTYNNRDSLLNGHFFVCSQPLVTQILEWYKSQIQ